MGIADLFKTGAIILDVYVTLPDSGTLKIPGGSHCHFVKSFCLKLKQVTR